MTVADALGPVLTTKIVDRMSRLIALVPDPVQRLAYAQMVSRRLNEPALTLLERRVRGVFEEEVRDG